MGNHIQCIRPSPEKVGQSPSHRFKVRNMNETGWAVNKGHMEVTKTDLILHRPNSKPVRWPLRFLRGYGYDSNVFTFESGRRCTTGPGIYAFKCKQALQLFQLVRENAQHNEENGSATVRQRSTSSDNATSVSRSSSHLSGMALPVANGNTSSHTSINSNLTHTPVSPSPVFFATNSVSSNSLRLSPISPTIQYVNASAFGDIPESPLENGSLPNGAMTEDVPSLETSRDSSYGDPALNYARLKLSNDEERDNHHDDDDGGDKREEEEDRVNDEDVVIDANSKKDDVGADHDAGEEDDPGLSEKISNDSEDVKVTEGEIQEIGEKDDCKEDESMGGELTVAEVKVEHDDVNNVTVVDGKKGKCEEKSTPNIPRKGDAAGEDERTALLQDVMNRNIPPNGLKLGEAELGARYGVIVNYANLTEQQVQDVLQKIEMARSDNMSPCTVCSTTSSTASQRVSPLSYYANLDTAGELPTNWQANGFQFYSDIRTPRSTSSKGSSSSEFTFDVTRGSCSPVEHNYANLDTLPEVQPLRNSLSGSAATGGASWMVLQPPPKGKMNYIQLDFDQPDAHVIHNVKPLKRSISSSASSTPPKTPATPQLDLHIPPNKTDIYAKIDIEKTVALANSHWQMEGHTDISTRRTRHDACAANTSR